MPILVGTNNINDIRIGSTAINYVYVGANLVWVRLSLTTSPSPQVTAINNLTSNQNGTAVATITVATNPATTVDWSYTQISGSPPAQIGQTGTSAQFRLIRPASSGAGSTDGSVQVIAKIAGNTVGQRNISLSAVQEY